MGRYDVTTITLSGSIIGTHCCEREDTLPIAATLIRRSTRIRHAMTFRGQVVSAMRRTGSDFTGDTLLTNDTVIIVRRTVKTATRERITTRRWRVRQFKALRGLVSRKNAPRRSP